jgi:hypothetical protein
MIVIAFSNAVNTRKAAKVKLRIKMKFLNDFFIVLNMDFFISNYLDNGLSIKKLSQISQLRLHADNQLLICVAFHSPLLIFCNIPQKFSFSPACAPYFGDWWYFLKKVNLASSMRLSNSLGQIVPKLKVKVT